MPLRPMAVTALLFAIAATALLIWPEAPAERVATRAEMIAAHAVPHIVPVAVLATCTPVVRATDI